MSLEKLFPIPYSLRLTKGGIYSKMNGDIFSFFTF